MYNYVYLVPNNIISDWHEQKIFKKISGLHHEIRNLFTKRA